MEVITILSIVLFDTLISTHAGLLDAFGSVVDNTFQQPMRAFNPRFQINNTKEALEVGFNGNTDRSYDRDHYWTVPGGEPRKVVNGFSEQTDSDKLVAEAFPEGVELLNRLKELNKLKEEGKLNVGIFNRMGHPTDTKGGDDTRRNVKPKVIDPNNKHGNNGNDDTRKGNGPNGNGNYEKPINNHTTEGGNINYEKPIYNNKTEGATNNDDDVKSITITKYNFQAQPVVPENERKNRNMTIYYKAN